MEKRFSGSAPVSVERFASYRVLNYDIREATEAEIAEAWKYSGTGQCDVPTDEFVASHRYVYYSVRIPVNQWSYGGIVNAIVREKYDVSGMESLNNNITATVYGFFMELLSGGIVQAVQYLKDSFKDLVNTEDFKAMQEWRALAKREAREVLNLR